MKRRILALVLSIAMCVGMLAGCGNGGGGIGYEDGWEYTYTIPTQKEVDIIMSLMDVAQPVSVAASESQTTKIILEEAASFWAGQKSVEEAAAIIQSRIQIYVDENR